MPTVLHAAGALRHRVYIEDSTGTPLLIRWGSINAKPNQHAEIVMRDFEALSYGHILRYGGTEDYGDLTAEEMENLTAVEYATLLGSDFPSPPRYWRILDIQRHTFKRDWVIIEGIEIAPLIHKVTLQTPTRTTSSKSGETQLTWNDTRDVWASIKPASVKDQTQYAQTQARITHEIVIRYADDITGDMRFTYNGRIFNIVAAPINTEEINFELRCQCSEEA